MGFFISLHRALGIYFKLKLIRYAFVGGISTLVHIGSAFLFIYFFSSSVYLSNIFGFSWAFLFSYAAQSRYVFDSRLSMTKAFKYLIVQLCSLFVAIELSMLADAVNAYLRVLLVAAILPLITFGVHKIWTFSD